MAKIQTMDEMAKQLAGNALDNFLYDGKSLREWMKIIASEDAISKSKTLEHLKKRLYETAINNVGCTLEKAKMDDISGVFTEIAENRIDTWINELPPIQPKAKAGKWIKYGRPRCDEQHYQCTACNYYINFGKWGDLYTKEFRYCPNCGAKMKSEVEE